MLMRFPIEIEELDEKPTNTKHLQNLLLRLIEFIH